MSGGRAPHFSVWCAMTSLSIQSELADFVALSLLPFWCRLPSVEALRAGDAPADVVGRLAAAHWRDEPERIAAVRWRAAAALRRAHGAGLTLIAGSDSRYPAALAAIVDPPPVLWTRGVVDALSTQAVAIV